MTDESPMTPGEQAGLAVLMAAYRRWQTMPPVAIEVSRRDAYLLMCGMQLLQRHPDLRDDMKQVFERIGRQAQEATCDDVELYSLAEAGWNPAADMEPGG